MMGKKDEKYISLGRGFQHYLTWLCWVAQTHRLLREQSPPRPTSTGRTLPAASLSLKHTPVTRPCKARPLNCLCVLQTHTFSGLYIVDGHFSPVQDHVLPLPALASLPVSASKKGNYITANSANTFVYIKIDQMGQTCLRGFL